MATAPSHMATEVQRAELREIRRELRRRQVRRRRLTALAIVALLVVLGVGIARIAPGTTTTAVSLSPANVPLPPSPFHTQLPDTIRGLHVTMNLASLPGKLAQYVALKREGLNTSERDVKDENGHVGFVQGIPALARQDGAAATYYDPRAVARQLHQAGMYLIGRVVAFEDPVAATRHPDIALHRTDGRLWHPSGGLARPNPSSPPARAA